MPGTLKHLPQHTCRPSSTGCPSGERMRHRLSHTTCGASGQAGGSCQWELQRAKDVYACCQWIIQARAFCAFEGPTLQQPSVFDGVVDGKLRQSKGVERLLLLKKGGAEADEVPIVAKGKLKQSKGIECSLSQRKAHA
eukprot:1160722-Pelagomonas_calceolata.AAC.15